MKLSVLEQSSLSEGSSAGEAISNTVSLSKELDRLGYNRIWLSEHHNLNILQGSTPEVLLAAIGAQTNRIRLGTGGVMLPNHITLPRTFARLKPFTQGDWTVGSAGPAAAIATHDHCLCQPPMPGGTLPIRPISWRAIFTTPASVLLP